MQEDKVKVVIWCGAAPNQKALACKIADRFRVTGIVIDERPGSLKTNKWSRLPSLIYDRIRFKRIYDSWKNLMAYYDQKFLKWPDTPVIRVAGINSKETLDFTNMHQPDLIVVSGTALIKEPLLSFPARIGIINLHTGLSPYVKGAPNCTNWCIANNTWKLVGNTIMWLNAGIDAGNIITTEAIDIRNAENLNKAHICVMDHAHDLYLRAIQYLTTSRPPYSSVPQNNIGKGQLFLSKMWTAQKRKQLLLNWKRRNQASMEGIPVTIPLPDDNVKSFTQ